MPSFTYPCGAKLQDLGTMGLKHSFKRLMIDRLQIGLSGIREYFRTPETKNSAWPWWHRF